MKRAVLGVRSRPAGWPLLLLCWLAATAALASGAPAPAAVASWNFRVLLDGREIGQHRFDLSGAGPARELRSVARFEYRLGFIPLYRYRHESHETWDGDCLTRISTRTEANGRPYQVSGALEAGELRVLGPAGEQRLAGCVMSFAYWNPAFLDQLRLLNSQDGALLEVTVSPPVAAPIEVRGRSLPAWQYQLQGGELQLRLWYSQQREWLALESRVAGGRVLRYELM